MMKESKILGAIIVATIIFVNFWGGFNVNV